MKKYNTHIIKMKIIEKGYSQREIAKMLGIREETLSRWIAGKLGNIDTFIELCKILDIDIKDL